MMSPSMTKINISGSYHFTSVTLKCLVQSTDKWESLGLDDCNKVNNEVFFGMIQHGCNLKKLEVFKQWNLNIQTLNDLP